MTSPVFLVNILCYLFGSEVRVEGLETLDYFDNLKQRQRFTEQTDAVTFDGEVSSSLGLCQLVSFW